MQRGQTETGSGAGTTARCPRLEDPIHALPVIAAALAWACTAPDGAKSTGSSALAEAPSPSDPTGEDGTSDGEDGATDSSDGASDGGDGGDGASDSGHAGGPVAVGPRGLLISQTWDARDVPLGAGAGQYGVIVLQESMFSLLPDVRAANPHATILAYQKVGGMRADGGEHASTGLRVDQADEAWFLHDAAGDRLTYCDYPEVSAADIGHPDYQQAWLEAVSERLLRDGFDGVMMDDVNTFPGHCLGSRGTAIAEYASDADYGEAVVGFMLAVGPALKADGLSVAPNIAMNPWDPNMRDQAHRMLPGVTHWLREYWMRWDDSANFTGDMWASTLETMVAAQSAGVGYLALTLGPGAEGAEAGQRYGRAAWLLAWDGESDSHWGYLDASRAGDPYGPGWAADLGRPIEPASDTAGGWRRAYERGVVVVHPGDEAPITVELEGSYRDSSGAWVTAVTLDSGDAAILLLESR